MKRDLRYYKRAIRNAISTIRLFPYIYKRKYSYKKWDYYNFKKEVLNFVESMRGNDIYEYRFSASQSYPDLYSSTYALMIYGLFNEIENMPMKKKELWANYILLHQNEDGLFRDKLLQTDLAESLPYWGWLHLAPHIIIGLDYLKCKPKYDFVKILKIFETRTMSEWLESRNWNGGYTAVSNEIMNIGVLLQYSRDHFNNTHAIFLIEELKKWLSNNKIDPDTSLWSPHPQSSFLDLHEAINTSYHIIPIFIFDNNKDSLNADKILKYALKNQHFLKGFGTSVCSDACSDIDSLYLLTILTTHKSNLKNMIRRAVITFMNWVFTNMNTDAGFVFRRFAPFQYGDQPILSSKSGESNMFATWFRVLSIAYACKYLKLPNGFKFSKVSGYQYHP